MARSSRSAAVSKPLHSTSGRASAVFVWLFVGALLALVASGRLPVWLALCYLLLSLATFMVYAWDKRAARRQAWRTQESTLHLLALLGGWPGALCAQRWLRHKSSKGSFQWVFWLTVVVNMLALLLLSRHGFLPAEWELLIR
ncbi:DUF1294 domain-containing protein [Pokkaliibacter plantistimulans]|uniref:DUF1294 domain-containing protein n=1 Tax=Proteobacteria bacterium 228 TaxID=2083153 RepID=A0A2S5KN29_9PROT|nr:DUF1294 domain-containing protein [Pokkaliibacter plantistimulans]PPC76122.1 DUF1294 domain-containing protein [Pokkaliibacter plantistimulans]